MYLDHFLLRAADEGRDGGADDIGVDSVDKVGVDNVGVADIDDSCDLFSGGFAGVCFGCCGTCGTCVGGDGCFLGGGLEGDLGTTSIFVLKSKSEKVHEKIHNVTILPYLC